ncbi:MAG: ABC transporter ATP-binding protein [Thermodesulfobacteriota bacterium]
MLDNVLELKNIVAGYGRIDVLRNVSLSVRRGEIVTMIGSNGAGKSTTLKTIFGLTHIASGKILFEGADVTSKKVHDLVAMGLAFVPQERNIFPSLTVFENLEMGAYTLPPNQVAGRIAQVCRRFPILRTRASQKAGTLSGGERQMLAIARGLMSGPSLMLLDEPSLGLAPLIISALFEQIQAINQAGTTVLLIEQNARRALSIANRGYVMELGQIRHEGKGGDLLQDEQVQRTYLGTGEES